MKMPIETYLNCDVKAISYFLHLLLIINLNLFYSFYLYVYPPDSQKCDGDAYT